MPRPLEQEHIHALLTLTLNPEGSHEALAHAAALTPEQRAELLALAESHHVVLRAFEPLLAAARAAGSSDLSEWLAEAMAAERSRIENAISHLYSVCQELEAARCPVTVMKTLDHWPDLGSDMDLYTTADSRRVLRAMVNGFNARIEPRSWGDRLAGKWNFSIQGLPEAIEIHVQRLGQTGEHTALARRFHTRRVLAEVGGYGFFMPAPEERIIVATLQRMYRHFYFRICDIVNSSKLVESGAVDIAELRRAAEAAGIWPGVASYLRIVSDYVKRYRGRGLELPAEVYAAARVAGDDVHVGTGFLRVPILPHGAELYTRQVTHTAFRGDVAGTFRLSLLPPLASAAAVAYKITGSDKGVW